MKYHFDAAILLVTKGLVQFRAIHKVITAVGNQECGVDLAFLDQLHQWFQIALYVGLAAANGQPFLHNSGHVHRYRSRINAGHGYNAAGPNCLNGLFQRIGPLRRRQFFLNRT